MLAGHHHVFRALADSTRREVFERLCQSEAAVNELTKSLHVTQPAVSQHLAVLRDAGLVSLRQEGRSRIYRAEPAGLAPLFDWLGHYQKFWPKKLSKLKSTLEEMK